MTPETYKNTFEQILQDAQQERIKRRLQRQVYSDYWQTRNQDRYAQRPTQPMTPQEDKRPPLEHREWIRRRIQEVLQDD